MIDQKPLTDEEGEVRELTEEDFALFVPLKDVDPELAEFSRQRKRGRPMVENPKATLTLRMDSGIIARLRERKGYNVRVEMILREALEQGRL